MKIMRLAACPLFLAAAFVAAGENGAMVQTRSLKDVVGDYMGEGLEVAITPTPRKAEMRTLFFRLGS